MSTAIKPCKCESAFQDSIYGRGKRLMNECKDGRAYRCTVCGKEISTVAGKK